MHKRSRADPDGTDRVDTTTPTGDNAASADAIQTAVNAAVATATDAFAAEAATATEALLQRMQCPVCLELPETTVNQVLRFARLPAHTSDTPQQPN